MNATRSGDAAPVDSATAVRASSVDARHRHHRRRPRGRGAAGGRGPPDARAPVSNPRRAHRRRHAAQGRELPAHRRLQVPRRVQPSGCARSTGAGRWRPHLLVGQPQPGRGALRPPARHRARWCSCPRTRRTARWQATSGYGAEILRFNRYTQDREEITARTAARLGLHVRARLRRPLRHRRPGHHGAGADRGGRTAGRPGGLLGRRRPARRLHRGRPRPQPRAAGSWASSRWTGRRAGRRWRPGGP